MVHSIVSTDTAADSSVELATNPRVFTITVIDTVNSKMLKNIFQMSVGYDLWAGDDCDCSFRALLQILQLTPWEYDVVCIV